MISPKQVLFSEYMHDAFFTFCFLALLLALILAVIFSPEIKRMNERDTAQTEMSQPCLTAEQVFGRYEQAGKQ